MRQFFARLLCSAAATLAIAGCDSSSPAAPAAVASVSIIAPTGSATAGSTLALSATLRDDKGSVLTGRAITWTSGQPAIATIDGNGLVTALVAGATTITAASGGRIASLVVVVLPMPVATVQVSSNGGTVAAGSSLQLDAVLTGAGGVALPDRAVAWRTDNIAVATIDAGGLLVGVSAGTVTVTAESEGRSGSTSIVVTPMPAPVIASVAPSALVAGAAATITGTGFDSAPANNLVTIGGSIAPILNATGTGITVAVPCIQSGSTTVQVRTRGVPSSVANATMTGLSRALAVGQSLVLDGASSICNEFRTTSPDARYLVTVFSASTSPSTLVDFEVGGNTPPVSVAAVDVPHPSARGIPSMLGADPSPGGEATRDAAHFAMLERNRADYERLRRIPGALPAARALARTVAAPALGDIRSLYYTFNGGCADTSRVIRGRVIYAGTRSIIWEDSANTVQSSASEAYAEYLRRLGEIFDTDQYESVKRTFGDPLVRDANTDGDGRVHMVFSQRLNGSGAAAFVTSCDMFPSTRSAGSNVGEFFYGMVPTSTALSLTNNTTLDGWFYFMGRTVVHEVKHISSMAARIARNSPFEVSWLEEGTARHAEEMWVRESLHHTAWKGNNSFGTAATNGLYCDFHPSESACLAVDPLRRPSYGMRRHFNEILPKLAQPWNYSPYGDGIGQAGSTFYQTAWSLVRYTIDRYATSDAAFFSALVNSSSTGVTNLAAVAGVPLDRLIGGWGLALYADDYPGLPASNADLQFPTWNLRDIYAGLNASPSWSGRFPTAYPIQPVQLGFGPFSSRVTGLRGGAHAYFEIAGSARPVQLVALRSPDGGTPSPLLRIAIARLQ